MGEKIKSPGAVAATEAQNIALASSTKIKTNNDEAQRLSRHQRRRMKDIAERVDRVTRADKLFFDRFPHRQHRVRVASVAEREQEELMRGHSVWLPPGCLHYTVVKNIAPGVRLRLFIVGPDDADCDVTEQLAAAVYLNNATEYTRRVEADMRQALEYLR